MFILVKRDAVFTLMPLRVTFLIAVIKHWPRTNLEEEESVWVHIWRGCSPGVAGKEWLVTLHLHGGTESRQAAQPG